MGTRRDAMLCGVADIAATATKRPEMAGDRVPAQCLTILWKKKVRGEEQDETRNKEEEGSVAGRVEPDST